MRYKSFVLTETTKILPSGVVQSGIGIFKNGSCLECCQNYELAKRVVDDRIKRKKWQNTDEKSRGRNWTQTDIFEVMKCDNKS